MSDANIIQAKDVSRKLKKFFKDDALPVEEFQRRRLKHIKNKSFYLRMCHVVERIDQFEKETPEQR